MCIVSLCLDCIWAKESTQYNSIFNKYKHIFTYSNDSELRLYYGYLNSNPMHRLKLSFSIWVWETYQIVLQFTALSTTTQLKRFRVLTGWLVGSQVFEMDAFDDLHRQTSCCRIVYQPHKNLWCGSLTDGLEWWGAFTACHIWEADLGFTSLKVFTDIQKNSLVLEQQK